MYSDCYGMALRSDFCLESLGWDETQYLNKARKSRITFSDVEKVLKVYNEIEKKKRGIQSLIPMDKKTKHTVYMWL